MTGWWQLQGLRPAQAGGRWTQEPVRPVPLEAEWGEEWGVRRAAWRQPFIRASYVMCQHLSAFSERLNSAVRPLCSPLPTPALPSLLSAHARTRRLPVFRQAGERQRCAVEWSVQSDPGCYVIVGSVTMDTAEMCGGVERGGGGGREWGGGGRGDLEPSKGWTPESFMMLPTNQPGQNDVRVWLDTSKFTVRTQSETELGLSVLLPLHRLEARIHSYSNY